MNEDVGLKKNIIMDLNDDNNDNNDNFFIKIFKWFCCC